MAGVKIAISMPSPRNDGFPINRCVDIIDNLCSTKRGIGKSATYDLLSSILVLSRGTATVLITHPTRFVPILPVQDAY
jgi:hypothetical protein